MGGLLEFTFYIPTLTHSLPKSISRLHASQPSSTSDSVMGSKASQASFFSQGPEAGPAFDVWSSTCLPSGRERNSMARTEKKSGKIRSCLKLSTYNYIHTIILTFHSIYSIALPYTTYIMCIYIYIHALKLISTRNCQSLRFTVNREVNKKNILIGHCLMEAGIWGYDWCILSYQYRADQVTNFRFKSIFELVTDT